MPVVHLRKSHSGVCYVCDKTHLVLCVCVSASACKCVIVLGIRQAAYYWMESLWGFWGRRTSIRRLTKHYQLIRPVITPAVRKRSKLTPVWKQSDNANTATKPPRVCMYICKRVYGWVSARMCVCVCVRTEVSLAQIVGVRTVKLEWVGGSGGSTSGGNLLYNSVYYCCGWCLRSTHTITVHSARLQVASGLN